MTNLYNFKKLKIRTCMLIFCRLIFSSNSVSKISIFYYVEPNDTKAHVSYYKALIKIIIRFALASINEDYLSFEITKIYSCFILQII